MEVIKSEEKDVDVAASFGRATDVNETVQRFLDEEMGSGCGMSNHGELYYGNKPFVCFDESRLE